MELHIERRGDGLPIVFSHGLGDTCSTWDSVFESLAERFDVTRWDLRGHGRSAAPMDPAAYSKATGLEDLGSVIATVGAPVALVGHSLGGYLSLATAIDKPELVSALVLVAAGPGFRNADAKAAFNRRIGKVVADIDAPVAGLGWQGDDSMIENIESLQCPTLLLVGEHDKAFHGAMAYIGQRAPASTTRVVPAAGHHPQRVDPNTVATEIRTFVDEAERA